MLLRVVTRGLGLAAFLLPSVWIGPSTGHGKTVLMHPVDGFVVNRPGGLVVGFCSDQGKYEVELDLNGKKHTIELWDGVFDIDLDWEKGRNTVSVGGVKATFVYDPFADGKAIPSVHRAMLDNCGNCHVLGESLDLSLSDEAGKLCDKCHEVVQGGLEHSTVACDVCHVPHTSVAPKLVKIADTSFCVTCHPKPLTGEEEYHEGVWHQLACKRCHFRPPGNSVCHSCHIQESAPTSSVHGKVRGKRRCNRCHIPHHDGSEALSQTCQGCHGAMGNTTAGHESMVAKACGTCHSMHREESKVGLKSTEQACAVCHPKPNHPADQPADSSCVACHGIHFRRDSAAQ